MHLLMHKFLLPFLHALLHRLRLLHMPLHRPLYWRSHPVKHPTLEPRLRGAALLLGTALSAAALGACIVLPQTQMVYDPDCRMHTRQVTLEAAYLGGFHRCAGDGCLAMLAAVGVVTAASVVVSGSIALVGNVVYWMERQGRCPRAPAPAPLAPPSPALSPAPFATP